jgi:hypothetical protein
MFDMVVNAPLPTESLRMVFDFITDPPEDLPYAEIKEGHSSSHQLMDFCVWKSSTPWTTLVAANLLIFSTR